MMSINSLLTKQHLSNQMTKKQKAIELLKQGNNGEEDSFYSGHTDSER